MFCNLGLRWVSLRELGKLRLQWSSTSWVLKPSASVGYRFAGVATWGCLFLFMEVGFGGFEAGVRQ